VFELAMVVAIALLFDFTNGFHDAANAIATSVATRSISPRMAVICAGALNFAGAYLSLNVAKTIGKGIIDPGAITLRAILAGLVGAITWNLVTWWRGLPTSSSHALIGGVAGAAIASTGGFDVVLWTGLREKVIEPSIYVPLLGFGLAAVLALCLAGRVGRFLDARPGPLRGLQLVSAGFVALTHGTNDAQKTMGVIALALVVSGENSAFVVDDWVIFAAALAIALGTYVGGWRIVHTVGRRLSDLDLRSGVAAQSAAAFLLWRAADFGFPISTTQVTTGAVLGSGSKKRWRGTRWSVAGHVVAAWVITLPCAALVGAGYAELARVPGGAFVIYALVAAAVAGMLIKRRLLFAGWEAQIERHEPAAAATTAVAPEPPGPKRKRRPKALA
jgi:PiT family inorganic phosphate transporter